MKNDLKNLDYKLYEVKKEELYKIRHSLPFYGEIFGKIEGDRGVLMCSPKKSEIIRKMGYEIKEIKI